MGTTATRSAPRVTLRRALVSAGVAITSVAALTACGGDSSDENKPDNPAAGSSGTYQATITTDTINGKPPDPSNEKAKPQTATWIVRSTCDGPGDRCIAVAASTTPTAASLNRDRMEFVFENRSWTRVVEPTVPVCTATATKQPVKELAIGMQTTTLQSEAPVSTAPIAVLTGAIDVVYGGTCPTVIRGGVVLRRTGELPADAQKLPAMPVAEAVTDPPGAALRGTYDIGQKTISADPPSFLSVFTPQNRRVKFRPICTRDGSRCIAVSTFVDGSAGGAFLFAGGAYLSESTGPPSTCKNGSPTHWTGAIRIPVPADAPRPLARITGQGMYTFAGPCPGTTVRQEVALTRIGD